ncbi:unnamed protein product [Bursaphelenchus okinawaensis]|uniref:Neurotransmitter-gated ion-channel ligand-binding domain-containing protein n=1 Tax=Bursaphelenchus okinawaensis TaxID=465554 RepID=A0A811KD98_9BILA|nr:unnamed protein product [Bursaphelenchus okinawaensis]CAG9099593.1 unnamed protein product [Bursaphelenchus okinawaensis]
MLWFGTLISVFILLLNSASAASSYDKTLRTRQIASEGQIISRLFTGDYQASLRPPVREHANHATIVVITSIHINRVAWKTYSAEVDLYLRQQWEDNRLKYDVDVREQVEEIVIPNDKKIWMPDTYFGTARELTTAGSDKYRVVVEPSGYVRASEQKVIEVVVENSIAYPFHNTKSFRIRLASFYMWANKPPLIVPVEVSKELLDGDGYVLKDAYVGECVGNYTIGIYSCIDVVITFTGSAAAPIFQLLGPSVLLVVFSWLHFWIHGSWSVPRTVSATIPFLLFTVLIIFYPQPHLGRSGIGATQVWLIFCAAITFASLVEYFLVICTGAGSTKRAKYAPPQTLDKTPLTEVEIQSESKRGNYQATSNLDIIARIIFPIVFIIFVIIFLIFYLI